MIVFLLTNKLTMHLNHCDFKIMLPKVFEIITINSFFIGNMLIALTPMLPREQPLVLSLGLVSLGCPFGFISI
jgi:hypothetical protein